MLGVLLGLVLGVIFSSLYFSKKNKMLHLQIRGLSRKRAKQKKKLKDLERNRAHALAIIDNLIEGVVAVDSQRQVIMTNRSVQEMFNVTEDRALKKSFIELIGEQSVDQMMSEAIETQTIMTREIVPFHLNNRILRVDAVGISKSTKGVSGILMINDITKVKRLEKMRREFVTNVSHELKTPLTSIKGFVETLLGGALKDEEKSTSFLEMMQEDTNRLTRLIEDILELSKIESKEIPLNLERLDLSETCRNVLKSLHPQLEEKEIVINGLEDVALNVHVLADKDKLRQVWVNLLDNAIKYSPEKSKIHISSKAFDDYVEVSVQDEGPGIPADALGHLFERFFRVDKARSSELGGTGLGLAIVKHIIEAHGGKVGCESVYGKGARFVFTLRRA